MGVIKPPIGKTMAAAPKKKSGIVTGSYSVTGVTYSNIGVNSNSTETQSNVVADEKYLKAVRYNHNIQNLTKSKL